MSREKLIKSIETSLVDKLAPDTFELVIQTITKELNNFEVTDRCTDLIVHDDINQKLMKRYCACLMVDGKSEKTIYQYKLTLNNISGFLEKPFTEMGTYDIRYYLACRKEQGLSNRSLENNRANLSAFFQWMSAEEIIGKNPCVTIKPIKYKDEIRLPFSDVEIDAMRSACTNLKERAILEVLLSSGLRVSELSSARISDIDFQNMSIHVMHGKGDKERITFINSIAKKHLQEYLLSRNDGTDALFCNKDNKPLQKSGINYLLKQIGKRANVENVHPHRFRRTFATGLAKRGMRVQEIQKLLGHSNISTTMEYVCVDNEQVKHSYKQYIA